jgi:hypothetical protein
MESVPHDNIQIDELGGNNEVMSDSDKDLDLEGNSYSYVLQL